MPSSSRFLFGVSLLCVLPAFAGCRVAQPPPLQTEGLTIEVKAAKASKKSVDVSVKIQNDRDSAISFDLGDVRLIRGPNDEVSPNPPRGGAQPITVQQKNPAEFRWIFPLNGALPSGSYTIQIKHFRMMDIEQPNPIEFKINV